MKIIGIIHFLHAPLLLAYPLILPTKYDVYYIRYFFIIMFSYSLCGGENYFSFLYKKLNYPYYVVGDRIHDYDDLIAVSKDPKFVENYVFTFKCLYSNALLYVMYRMRLCPSFSIFTMLMTLIYFSNINIDHLYYKRMQFEVIFVRSLLRFYFIFGFIFTKNYIK
jgi:hypothetical protein